MTTFPKFHNVTIASQESSITLSILKAHPRATTILFYPGTMASPFMYPELLKHLHAMGCNVIGIHLQGHGLSPSNNRAFTMEDLIQNGRDAEAYALQEFSGPLVLCGHSQGGILTLAHCLKTTSIAAAFPICTLMPQMANAGTVTRLKNFLHFKEPFIKALTCLANVAPRMPMTFLAYLELGKILENSYKVVAPRSQCRNTYPLRFIHSLFTMDLHKASEDGTITCPFFLLTAKNDTLFPLALMEETLGAIKAPYKKLIQIHGGGHLCAVSKVYAQHIAAHITAHCAGLGLPLYTKNTKEYYGL